MTDTKVTINDTEYSVEDLTDEQRNLLAHIEQLRGKQANLRFQFTETEVALSAFTNMLVASFTKEEEEAAEEEVTEEQLCQCKPPQKELNK